MLAKSKASSAPRSDRSSSARRRASRSLRRRSKEMRSSQSTAFVPKVAVLWGLMSGLSVRCAVRRRVVGEGAAARSGREAAPPSPRTSKRVDDCRDQDEQPLEVELGGRAQPEERGRIQHLLEEQGAEECSDEGASAAKQARASEHDRGHAGEGERLSLGGITD